MQEALGGARAAVAAAVTAVGESVWQVPQAQLLEVLRVAAELRGAVESVFLGVVAEVDARDGGVGSRTVGVVREVTGGSPGAVVRDVAAARVVGSGGVLAGFGQRLRVGRVNREHVDVAVRCLEGVPGHLMVTAQDRAVVTGFLTTMVDAGSDASALRGAVRVLLDRLDPDGSGRVDPHAGARRFLDLGTDATGMLVGRFQLDAAAGAVVRAAIDAHSAPAPEHPDGDGVMVRDPRTARQRRADALTTVAELALGVGTPRRGERPRIVVHTTPHQLAAAGSAGGSSGPFGGTRPPGSTKSFSGSGVPDGTGWPDGSESSPGSGPPGGTESFNGASPAGPGWLPAPRAASATCGCTSGGADRADRVDGGDRWAATAVTESGHVVPPWLLGRLSCDAVLQRVLVDPDLGPLDVGREHRLATLAQRRALAVRDGGCVICGAPPDWCDAHHVTPWAHGGATDLVNLALLCPRHHTDVHTGTWDLHHDAHGKIQLIPPRHHDPTRTPRSPVFHTTTATLDQLDLSGAPAP